MDIEIREVTNALHTLLGVQAVEAKVGDRLVAQICSHTAADQFVQIAVDECGVNPRAVGVPFLADLRTEFRLATDTDDLARRVRAAEFDPTNVDTDYRFELCGDSIWGIRHGHIITLYPDGWNLLTSFRQVFAILSRVIGEDPRRISPETALSLLRQVLEKGLPIQQRPVVPSAVIIDVVLIGF